MAEGRLSPALASVGLAKADIPHGMMSKWHMALPTATWSCWELPFRTFGPRTF